MARELHVVVHEDSLIFYALKGDKTAERILDELRRIRREKDHLLIWDEGTAFKLDPHMPPPSDDLNVIVCGGYMYECCSMQLYTLRKAGYNAEFHETACFDNGEKMPADLLPDDFKDVVPEYSI